MGFRFGRSFVREREVNAGAQGGDEGASKRSLVGGADGGGQVLGVGVDRETEEHELHQWDADHHAERHAVPLHLDKLLENDGPQAMEGEAGRTHAKLSFAASIKLMNTSSRPERIFSIRGADRGWR